VFLVSACGGGTPSASSSPASSAPATSSSAPATSAATSAPAQSGTFDSCQLAKQSDVDAAAGLSLAPPAPQRPPNPGDSTCLWADPNAPGVGGAKQGILITVTPLPPDVAPQMATKGPMFNGQIPGTHSISGLGDAASYISPYPLIGAGSVQMWVLVHARLIQLTLATGGSTHTSDPVQSMTTLARAAVGRLPG